MKCKFQSLPIEFSWNMITSVYLLIDCRCFVLQGPSEQLGQSWCGLPHLKYLLSAPYRKCCWPSHPESRTALSGLLQKVQQPTQGVQGSFRAAHMSQRSLLSPAWVSLVFWDVLAVQCSWMQEPGFPPSSPVASSGTQAGQFFFCVSLPLSIKWC